MGETVTNKDVFTDALRDAAAKFTGVPDTQTMVEVVKLRRDLEDEKKARRRWQMLVASILQEQGEIRVSRAAQERLPTMPVITVTDDPVTGELVLRLKR